MADETSTHPGKRLIGLVVAIGLSSALAGCTVFEACPAIGWYNTVTVRLDGETRNVSVVELCADGTCSVPDGGPVPTDEPLRLATLDPQTLEMPTADPTTPPARYAGSRIDERTWAFTMEAAPKEATLRALTAGGEVLVERDVELAWVRVGGTDRCGGPGRAGPISLTVAS